MLLRPKSPNYARKYTFKGALGKEEKKMPQLATKYFYWHGVELETLGYAILEGFLNDENISLPQSTRSSSSGLGKKIICLMSSSC